MCRFCLLIFQKHRLPESHYISSTAAITKHKWTRCHFGFTIYPKYSNGFSPFLRTRRSSENVSNLVIMCLFVIFIRNNQRNYYKAETSQCIDSLCSCRVSERFCQFPFICHWHSEFCCNQHLFVSNSVVNGKRTKLLKTPQCSSRD